MNCDRCNTDAMDCTCEAGPVLLLPADAWNRLMVELDRQPVVNERLRALLLGDDA